MNGLFGLGMILLFLCAVIFMPLLVLWALHTVFGVAVVYDLAHWFAVLVLGAFLGGLKMGFSSKKSD